MIEAPAIGPVVGPTVVLATRTDAGANNDSAEGAKP